MLGQLTASYTRSFRPTPALTHLKDFYETTASRKFEQFHQPGTIRYLEEIKESKHSKASVYSKLFKGAWVLITALCQSSTHTFLMIALSMNSSETCHRRV